MADADTQENDALPKTSGVKVLRPKLRKALPTDRATFSKQLDVLRAAAAASGAERKPVSNDDVAKIVNIHFGTVSNCNPFFLECGLFSRQKLQNVPCEEVFSYAERYKWDAEKSAYKLAPVLRKTWFCITLLPKLAFRPLSIDEAIGFLSEEAAATPEYKDQLAMLIDYLRVAGIVAVDGNMISAVDLKEPGTPPPPNGQQGASSNDSGKNNKPSNDSENDVGNIKLDLDSLLLALLQKIPAKGNEWPPEKRLRWFKTFAMNVSQVYDDEDAEPVELKITIETQSQ